MKNIIRWPVLWWLRFWAQLVLKKNRPFIVGVTGSAGKSSAVDAIAPVLKLKFKNLKVAEKANSESGIPADVLGLHFTDYSFFDWLRICLLAPIRSLSSIIHHPSSMFDAYLVEMGIDEPTPPKNMEYLLTILKPDIGVILNILPVHTEQFERSDLVVRQGRTLIESIATEKGKLITENQNLKYAILNADQPEIISLKPTTNAKIISFGNKNSDIIIDSVITSLSGTEINLQIPKRLHLKRCNLSKLKFENIVLPDYYGETIAAAVAVGMALNLPVKTISEALTGNFKLPSGRGRIFEGIKNTIIIDSSYNASGKTMKGSLEMLKNIGGNRIKIAVLGDMRELGSQAEIEHKKVAESAIKSADKIILVGPQMEQYALPITKKSKIPVEWFATAGQAKVFLEGSSRGARSCSAGHPFMFGEGKFIAGGEIILIKGSQNTIFLEIVVEALLKNKSDVENLCRRGKFWDKIRLPFI